MNKITTILLGSALLALSALSSFAQNDRNNQFTGEKCSSALIHQRLMNSDPAYKARVLANEQLIQTIIDNQKKSKQGSNSIQATVYKIPIVVHVIHLGEAVGSGTNISDAQIQSAIDNLNQAYRNQSPYTGVDIEVEFALAQRDPNCNATSGINRVNGAGVSDYSTNGLTTSGTDNEVTIKALSKWPNTTYYNVWVVAGIDGNMGGGGVQGFAYFPGASSSVDGTVILYNSFGYDPSGSLGYNLKSYTRLNVTTLHELGHAFNLYHTFEGDGSGSTCPTGNQCGGGAGDCCGDTPPHMRSNSDCDASGTNSCDGGSSKSLYVHNFMDYASDACQTEFTSDQKTRMRAAIIASRSGLVNSLATVAPSGSLPLAACIPVVVNSGSFATGVYGFTFNDLDISSGTTFQDGGYVDRTCYFQTTVNAGSNYPMTVNTGTANVHDVAVYIDLNNDGDFTDSGETMFTSNNVTGVHSGTISIPASPPITGSVLRMRVLADFGGGTISGPCDNPDYGQAEDFGIVISSAPGSPPVADFSASPTTVCAGSVVAFQDLSTNTPTSWSWTFQGGNPSTSTSMNPTVTYTAAGTYSVSLTATNGNGSDGETKLAYITVNATPTVNVSGTMTITSGSSTTLTATGGTTYVWTPGTGLSATTGSVVVANPSSTTAYSVTGTTNGCSNTKTFTVSVTPVVGPTNLQPAYCGITENVINLTLYCVAVGGATNYSYQLQDISTGQYYYYVRGSNATTFLMNWVPQVTYGKTYSIKVAAYVSGAWTAYGTACNVTTPAWPNNMLQPSSCNITETSLTQLLYCYTVTAASNYRYELTDQSTSQVTTYTRGNSINNFQMDLAGAAYGKTYGVKVASYVGTTWGPYGTSCNVTTPSAPTASLQAVYCGTTQTAFNQTIYCTTVTGATNYSWELKDNSTNTYYYYLRGNNINNFQMNWTTFATYGKTYTVRIAALVGGSWTPYGAACNITTPAIPTTKLANGSCNIVQTSFAQVMSCDAITGATNYRYEVTDVGNSNVYIYTRGNNLTNFQMNWVTGVTVSRNYSVKVAAYVGGAWLAYGPACTVTTAASLMGNQSEEMNRSIEPMGGISLGVYPNPNDGHVFIQVGTQAKLTVTNILGEVVYEGEVQEGTNELYFLDKRPGMYIIRVTDGLNSAQTRMIKE